MVENNKQSSLKVRNETYDQIRFLTEKSGISKAQLIAEVFEAIFCVACTFGSLNFEYDYDLSNSKVSINVSGKRKFAVSSEKDYAKTLTKESITRINIKKQVKKLKKGDGSTNAHRF